MFSSADIVGGLILIGVLLLVPLCAAGVVLAMAWLRRDGDATAGRGSTAGRPLSHAARQRIDA